MGQGSRCGCRVARYSATILERLALIHGPTHCGRHGFGSILGFHNPFHNHPNGTPEPTCPSNIRIARLDGERTFSSIADLCPQRRLGHVHPQPFSPLPPITTTGVHERLIHGYASRYPLNHSRGQALTPGTKLSEECITPRISHLHHRAAEIKSLL